MNLFYIKEQIQNYEHEFFSQLKQDVAALVFSNYKSNGFFVEFGACDGLHLSNTLLLEKKYNWKGILAEPSKQFNKKLKKNRSSIIDTRAVYSHSGEILKFKETNNQLDLSGLELFFADDNHTKKRKTGTIYNVDTVSLSDLLSEHSSPKQIDFLSIDTEGTELNILKNFNFDLYQINFLTVEHNFISKNREDIREILEKNNFTRILTDISEWDDWYVSNDIKESLL
jgi:FkbM family methyltransferase